MTFLSFIGYSQLSEYARALLRVNGDVALQRYCALLSLQIGIERRRRFTSSSPHLSHMHVR